MFLIVVVVIVVVVVLSVTVTCLNDQHVNVESSISMFDSISFDFYKFETNGALHLLRNCCEAGTDACRVGPMNLVLGGSIAGTAT